MWLWPGTSESWLALIVSVQAGLIPVWVKAGLVWGRMQAEDEAVASIGQD